MVWHHCRNRPRFFRGPVRLRMVLMVLMELILMIQAAMVVLVSVIVTGRREQLDKREQRAATVVTALAERYILMQAVIQ